MTNKDHLQKVISLNPTTSNQINGKIDSEEVGNMNKETYSKTEIDLKFDNLNQKLDHVGEKIDLKFEILNQRLGHIEDKIDLRFDSFEKRIENILFSHENERLKDNKKNRKEFVYWAIGIIVAIASVAIPIWFGK